MGTNLFKKSLEACPPPPPRFTLDEWHRNTHQGLKTSVDKQTLADSIIAECDRIIDEVEETTRLNKREVDHKLKEKIKDIEFNKGEIERQRKEVCLEIENLLMYNERIKDAAESLKERCLKICQNCLVLREGRIGIDLCHDDVEIELLKELDTIKGSQMLLERTLEQANEQIRRLRSTIYFMDRDLEDKGNVLKIDYHNTIISETSLNLSMYHGFTPLDPSNITLAEWEEFTRKNLEKAAKEINSARQLRSYVDTLLKQVIEDLINQYNTVNDCFRRRIDETKEIKTKLEMQHHEIVRQADEMTRTITKLEKAIAEKEGYMALAHTRLGNRAQRSGIELCKDSVGESLSNEVYLMRENVFRLQQILADSHATLRYLLKTQIQLEEDINIKTNTIKIDEVDCMSIRQGMDYHAY